MADPYAVLGVTRDDDDETIRRVYRELVVEHHPDQGGSAERLKRIKAAYETIASGQAESDTARTDGGTATASSGRTNDRVVASEIQGRRGNELCASFDGVDVRLTELVSNIDASPLLPGCVEDRWRTAACFRIDAGRERGIEWSTRRVSFAAANGETYRPSIYRPKVKRLPSDWRGDDLSIGSGERARVFVLTEPLPPGTRVDQVVYRPAIRYDDPILEFNVDGSRTQLRRNPFE